MWRWNTIGTCFCKKLYFCLRHISTVQEAVNMYLGEGSNLIPENGIGCDPLQDYTQLKVSRECDFFERFNMELVFQNILHSNGNLRTCIFSLFKICPYYY